jgi:hypothetical protein
MARREAEGEKGFVITLELVLIFTILGIGLMVGIVAIRNALFVYWQNKKAQTVWVYDSSVDGTGASAPNLLLPVRDFDEHEAPRVFFVDRNVEWCLPFGQIDCTPLVRNYRAFVGVRDDRFTTRQRVFYSESGCTGKPCLPAVSNEAADNFAIGFITTAVDTNGDDMADLFDTSQVSFAGGQGYLYALQHGPNFGVGADVDQTYNGMRLPGTLYRQTADACLENGESILSVWTSQEVTTGEPCLNLPATLEIDAAKCPDGQGGTNAGDACNVSPNVDPRCVTGGFCVGGTNNDLGCYNDSHCPGGTCDITPLICSCPVGWDNTSGANCCPPGSTETAPGQCTIGTDGVFFLATPVQHADGSGNAFANLTPPFFVNLPPDPMRFEILAPSGEEGVPGTSTGVPYDPDRVFDFGVAPASEGGTPP